MSSWPTVSVPTACDIAGTDQWTVVHFAAGLSMLLQSLGIPASLEAVRVGAAGTCMAINARLSATTTGQTLHQ
jgi:hypothetical protein